MALKFKKVATPLLYLQWMLHGCLLVHTASSVKRSYYRSSLLEVCCTARRSNCVQTQNT